jgi:LPXTG-site transpeptidase (sortase) family protein
MGKTIYIKKTPDYSKKTKASAKATKVAVDKPSKEQNIAKEAKVFRRKNINKLRLFNDLLTVVVVGICLYVILFPFWPKISLFIKQRTDKTGGIPYSGQLAQELGKDVPTSIQASPPKENRLVIPKLAINEQIFEGVDERTVNNGVWRRPKTSSPDQGSNTVLVGHRFTYKDPAVFYNLDKILVGDKFAVYWNQQELLYKVVEVKVVPATAIEIEAPTEKDILTIYTCTPIWTAKDRLVVVAEPINSPAIEKEDNL